jgi:hypothetical protein
LILGGDQLVSVKIINDMEGKPKGFGYVEFGTLDMLKEGLGRSGEVSFRFPLFRPRAELYASKQDSQLIPTIFSMFLSNSLAEPSESP